MQKLIPQTCLLQERQTVQALDYCQTFPQEPAGVLLLHQSRQKEPGLMRQTRERARGRYRRRIVQRKAPEPDCQTNSAPGRLARNHQIR